MHWIAPSEKDAANSTLEKRLWEAADQFRANSVNPQSASRSSPVGEVTAQAVITPLRVMRR